MRLLPVAGVANARSRSRNARVSDYRFLVAADFPTFPVVVVIAHTDDEFMTGSWTNRPVMSLRSGR